MNFSWIAQLVKNLPAMQEAPVPFLGREDPLEKGYATQYSGMENSMDCIVHRVSKSWTQLSEFGSMGSMIKIGINFSEGSIID